MRRDRLPPDTVTLLRCSEYATQLQRREAVDDRPETLKQVMIIDGPKLARKDRAPDGVLDAADGALHLPWIFRRRTAIGHRRRIDHFVQVGLLECGRSIRQGER